MFRTMYILGVSPTLVYFCFVSVNFSYKKRGYAVFNVFKLFRKRTFSIWNALSKIWYAKSRPHIFPTVHKEEYEMFQIFYIKIDKYEAKGYDSQVYTYNIHGNDISFYLAIQRLPILGPVQIQRYKHLT